MPSGHQYAQPFTDYFLTLDLINLLQEQMQKNSKQHVQWACLISKTLVKVSNLFDLTIYLDNKKAVVGDARKCTTCRECIRHEKFADIVDIGKIKDAFEFHVESVGIYAPERLVFEALKILKEKAVHWIEVLDA